jgi:HEPN domain-containing protein
LDRVIRNYEVEDYADCVFLIQLLIEPIQKSILFLIGLQFRKTHEPSIIIERYVLSQNNTIEENIKNSLLKIANLAKDVEQEETKTGYGVVGDERLITPEEEYDINKTKIYSKNLKGILREILKLLEDLEGFQDDCKKNEIL